MKSDIDVAKLRKLDGGLLLVLHHLIEHGSVTRTAQTLSLSQSTISHALARLRELFDDPLFLRRPHGLEPTRRALSLQPQIATLIEVACEALGTGQAFAPADSRRRFSLSAPEFVTATMATDLLRRLADVAPGVSMSCLHLAEPEVYEGLRRGEVDVAVGRFEQAHPDVECSTLFEDEFCVACRRGHTLARGRITAAGYRAARHIWANSPSETISRDAKFDYSAFHGSVVPRWLTALVVAAQSDYIATCPRRLAQSQADLLDLVVLDLPRPEPVVVSIACRRDLRDSGTEWFIEQVRAVFR